MGGLQASAAALEATAEELRRAALEAVLRAQGDRWNLTAAAHALGARGGTSLLRLLERAGLAEEYRRRRKYDRIPPK